MKKISLILLMIALIAICVPAWAVDNWQTANQLTIAWDPVAAPADGAVRYKVLLQRTDLAGAAIGDPLEMAEVDTAQYTITFPSQGAYIVGVRSVLVQQGQQVAQSAIAWSNDPASVANGTTFGARYFLVGPVTGLRLVQ